MRRIRLAAAAAAGLSMLTGAVTPVAAEPGEGPGARTEQATAPAVAGTVADVRLVTGDRVTVTVGPDGRRTASVQPGKGRQHILFRTIEEDGHLTVLPSDATELVTAGRLDRELFDVTSLIAQRYDEAHTDTLPLIVGDGPGVADPALRKATALAADGTPVRRLRSIDAEAVRVPAEDLGTFWKRLLPAGEGAARAAGTPRVWLDSRVSASLDRSTAQIGAPDVWKAGYQGDGVKVAVLDTGADTTHPDLAGRISAAEDFSGSSGTGDVFGHGTHVASIVGGSGAASGGSRKGVAPGADLLIGKVLGDDGFGTQSQVIAGMEWSVARGAKVVNMSLGSETASDGTDPMSQTLNELSASSGTLFVVAAGNSGPGQGTIGSPGAADAALTVGAVDRDDSLAGFSSRGPRVGDDTVKPDVTAPGVGIVAARATGTTMGEVVDGSYVAASGTSMATPHVAGAAALLAQQHPDWTASRLKDALTSTARTIGGQKVTEQGAGRIDLAAATRTPVSATGTLALGTYEADDSGTSTRTVRYTNRSDAPLTLGLRAELTTSSGRKVNDGAVSPGSASLTVPAGGTAELPLTVDPSRAAQGDYYGYLTASSADGKVSVHTTLSLVVRGPVHKLKVVSYDLTGERVHSLPTIWGPDGFVEYTDRDNAVAEVEEGTYQIVSGGTERENGKEVLRHIVLPQVRVTEDTTAVVDPRKTTKVDIRTPRPAEQRGVLSFQTYREIDGHGWIDGTMYFDLAEELYVSPTAQVTDGTFEFASRWQLVAPQLEAEVVGGPRDLGAFYMPHSPLFDSRGERLTAVAAGSVTEPDFRRVRGKLAVVTDETGVGGAEFMEKAAAAGARAVLVVHFSDIGWTRWTPHGDRWKIPTVRVGSGTGAALLKRIAERTTTVAFSGTARSPYLYDVMQVSEQRIPERVIHTVSERNSAVVRSVYADNGGVPWAAEQRFARRPYQDFTWLQYTRHVPTAFERTEYVTSGDTEWYQVVLHQTVGEGDIDRPLTAGLREAPRTYRAGEQVRHTWQGAVVRPSIPRGAEPSTRNGDMLRLRIPEFTDSEAGHWSRQIVLGDGIGTGEPTSRDTANAELFRDGKKVLDLADAWRDVEVPAGNAEYRLRLETTRESDEWDYATATDTSWSFRSDSTTEATRLPLLQVDYDVPVDERNAVGPGRTYSLGLTVRNQDGLGAPRGVRTVVEVSYDDGEHFSRVPVKAKGANVFSATVHKPAAVRGDAFVTLRVTAEDAYGNSVRQTVSRAYLHRG
ncbi:MULTISPECIES: S8 family serine peptidase [unclassified Streptomyces]|uniref:S8 family peptidase n=1 Tax=unclassified Streptomyces TaxID=2593676 RepID=UPI001488C249|nr:MULTISPECIES: S8 family serine peptidase [unclassified Streptomyces]